MTNSLTLHTAINNELLRTCASGIKTPEILCKIWNMPKSKADSCMAMLYAYVRSKGMKFETDRFMYLWMAFNGMYSRLSNSKGIEGERNQISYILSRHNYGTKIMSSKERNRCGKKTMGLIKVLEQELLFDNLTKEDHHIYKKVFDYIKKTGADCDITPYGYIIGDFAYYLRCSFFHTQKPVCLFGFVDDTEIAVLRVVNNLLETFIDNNIQKYI